MSNGNLYKLLVFDWDGTLLDSEAKIIASVHAATDELNLERIEADKIRNIIGLGLREAVEDLFPGVGSEIHARIMARYRHYFSEEEAVSAVLFPEVVETLQSLKDLGYLLAVATGKSRRGLLRDFDMTGLQEMFHSSRCADETQSKPHPQMLEEIMEELFVGVDETVMIGDTEYDLQMASNAGTHAVAVSYGAHERQRLLQFEPHLCIDSITDLLGWLTDLNSTPPRL